ncbi:MAG: hypothetical protein HYV97_19730 [Bdellovibrio sp.]|nr:hypothetical protein [Bdellovibrio sp.]
MNGLKFYLNKQGLVCLIFFLVMGYVAYVSLSLLKNSPQGALSDSGFLEAIDENYFQGVNYFNSKPGGTRLKLHAEEASILDKGNRVVFFSPKGQAETKAGQIFDYQGRKGLYLKANEYLMLEQDVDVTSVNMKLKSQMAEYFANKEKVVANGEVKSWALDARTKDRIRIFGDHMEWFVRQDSGEFTGHVDGTIKRQRAFEESVDFKCDFLKFNLLKSWIGLDGHVYLKKQDLTATSLHGEIFLENYNKKLKYYTLFDDVKVTEKLMVGGKPLVRRALSERLEGFMAENKVILTGSPKVFQETDTIKGNVIILRPDTEVVEVDDATTNFILK